MKNQTTATLALLFSITTVAAAAETGPTGEPTESLIATPLGNPGKNAKRCVTLRHEKEYDWSKKTKPVIVNNCSQHVFVIWCGDLEHSSSDCGDGPGGGYFTHSTNLKPGKKNFIAVDPGGDLHWGACFGRIGFGGRGEVYDDRPDGSYSCLKN